MTKNFTLELSSKSVGVGLNLALLKDNSYGDPLFFSLLLKGKDLRF